MPANVQSAVSDEQRGWVQPGKNPGAYFAGNYDKYVNLASEDVKEINRRFSPIDNLDFRVNWRGRPRLMP
jgi:hypothetical protein